MTGYNYLETEEGKRRFNQIEAYELSLKYQKDLEDLGIAWHNDFSNECVVDFSCCCGSNLDENKKYHTFIPSDYSVVKLALSELYEIVKHGDTKHKEWLKKEFEKYLKLNY